MGADAGSVGVVVTLTIVGYAWWQLTGKYIAEDIGDWFKKLTDYEDSE